MTMPTPGEARSRQTAYLATEHWWKTRVERLRDIYRREAELHLQNGQVGSLVAQTFNLAANDLEALLAERPSR